MKVVIVSSFDISGGAARAAYRLHQALSGIGVDSRMVVQIKNSDDSKVYGASSFIPRYAKKCRHPLDQIPVWKYSNRTLFSPSWLPSAATVRKINSMNPDVVHLHWIEKGMLSIEDLAKIKAPIVWSLHDMWSFTGGCHYDEDCGAYTSHCGTCKVLRSQDENDLSRRVYSRKAAIYSSIKSMTIVGLSRWLAGCASQSSLFKNRDIVNLPNPIDVRTFSPVDRRAARDHFTLPHESNIVLYGAMDATTDPRKGYAELMESLSHIQSMDVELAVFGSDGRMNHEMRPVKTHFIGNLSSDEELQILYSAADLMVVPSKQENLSNIIMESLSCGTPVVAFDTGGNCDLVDHKCNGYLAKSFDARDLAAGIDWILGFNDPAALSEEARNKVLDKFEAGHVAEQYLDLYRKLAA